VYDAFVFGSIPRLLAFLRMRLCTSKQYANIYAKTIFIGPRSIAGVPSSQALPGFLITAPMARKNSRYPPPVIWVRRKFESHGHEMWPTASPSHTRPAFEQHRGSSSAAGWHRPQTDCCLAICRVMHAGIQVPPDGVVGSRNCRCHPLAACCCDNMFQLPDCQCFHFGLLAGAPLHSQHPTDCLAYFG